MMGWVRMKSMLDRTAYRIPYTALSQCLESGMRTKHKKTCWQLARTGEDTEHERRRLSDGTPHDGETLGTFVSAGWQGPSATMPTVAGRFGFLLWYS